MYWIERRAGRSLFSYIVASQTKYSALSDYQPQLSAYSQLVAELLSPEWSLYYRGGFWCQARIAQNLPSSGFKIHISSTFRNAELTLQRVLPVLLAHRVQFKFLVDPFCLRYVNSQQCSKSASGKFITIYPENNEQFCRLIPLLTQATADLSGPYILSDQRVEGSKVVFYRYGGFSHNFRLNIYGEQEPLMQLPTGQWVADKRSPVFSLPEGVTDPLQQKSEMPEEIILNQRYKVLGFLADSNKGGVYKALDQQTGLEVVIKEARPFINESEQQQQANAISLLKNEFKALSILAKTGSVPKVIEQFDEWEHSFVVMEMLPGAPLNQVRAHESFALALKTNPSVAEIRLFYRKILAMAELMLKQLQAVHQAGVVLIDVAPQNMLYDEATDRLWFIDLEAARVGLDAEGIAGIATNGFADLNQVRNGQVSELTDYKAIANVLYNLIFPINDMFHFSAELKANCLHHFMASKGGTAQLATLLLELSDDVQRNAELLAQAWQSLDHIALPAGPQFLTQDQLQQSIKQLLHGIKANTLVQKGRFDYRPDYRVYSSHDFSFIHGITGVLSTLHLVESALPQALESQYILQYRQLDPGQLSPGIANGKAGVASFLWQIGMKSNALQLLQEAIKSPLLQQNADLYYGAAGVGFTALRCYKAQPSDALWQVVIQAEQLISAQLKQGPEQSLFIEQERGAVFHSLAHGAAGVAWFYLELYQVSTNPQHLHYAKQLMGFELHHARQEQDYLCWNRGPGLAVTTPYLRIGSAGLIKVLLKFYQVLQQPEYLQLARQAAVYLNNKISVTAGLLNGMAGLGQAMLDLYLVTREDQYLHQANLYASHIRIFAIERNGQLHYPGEDNLRLADDLGSGAAGVLHFFQRLATLSEGDLYVY